MKRLEHDFVCRVYGQDLSREIAGQFGQFKPHLVEFAFVLITVGFRFRGLVEVYDARIPSRDLDTLVAQACHPLPNLIYMVVRFLVPHELSEENGWAFHLRDAVLRGWNSRAETLAWRALCSCPELISCRSGCSGAEHGTARRLPNAIIQSSS